MLLGVPVVVQSQPSFDVVFAVPLFIYFNSGEEAEWSHDCPGTERDKGLPGLGESVSWLPHFPPRGGH